MKTITIEGIEYLIDFRPMKIGDDFVDLNTNTVHEAGLWEADDLGWVVVEQKLIEL